MDKDYKRMNLGITIVHQDDPKGSK